MKPSIAARLFLFAGFLTPLVASAASPNLTGVIKSVHVDTQADHTSTLRFEIAVSNSGDAPAEGNLKVKPFLVANDGSNAAVVLRALPNSLKIEAGASASLEFVVDLPVIEKREWMLGAILNSDWSIREEGPGFRFDNTPDLVPAGRFAIKTAKPIPAGGFDVYPRVVDSNIIQWGSIRHELRAVSRSNAALDGHGDSDLRALFGVIDFKTRKVKLLDYNRGSDTENPEKSWYAISWNPETDAGKPVYVDYYPNNILFGDLAPARYRFFTIMNPGEIVPENNVYDDMETSELDLSLVKVATSDSIYIGLRAGDTASRTVNLTSSFPGAVKLDASIVSKASSVALEAIAPFQSRATISIPVGELAAGKSNAGLHLVASATTAKGVAVQQDATIPLKYWVFTGDIVPKLVRSSAQIDLTAPQGLSSETKTVEFTNDGKADLEFKLQGSKPWVQISPRAGILKPGEKATISVTASPTANLGKYGYADVEASIDVQANAPDEESRQPIKVTLQTRQ